MNENRKEIKATYKKGEDKYKIEIKEGEEKVFTPEGEGKTEPKITVKNAKKGFLRNKAEINGKEETFGWNSGVGILGFIFIVALAGLTFLFIRRRNKNKSEEETL